LQDDDGTVDRLVTVHCDDDVLTPAAARKLAAAITAADESTGSHNGGASFAPAACRARRWSTARSSEQRRPAVAIMRAIGQAIWDFIEVDSWRCSAFHPSRIRGSRDPDSVEDYLREAGRRIECCGVTGSLDLAHLGGGDRPG
jgi:hypothetical protein